jgi:phosphoglycerate-specific signal transduction histidine kinase
MEMQGKEGVPEHCVDCPFISPYLDKIQQTKNAIVISTEHRDQLVELTDSDQEDVDLRIAQLEMELADYKELLMAEKARTIGCAGVLLTQARLDDEMINVIHCQSPFLEL